MLAVLSSSQNSASKMFVPLVLCWHSCAREIADLDVASMTRPKGSRAIVPQVSSLRPPSALISFPSQCTGTRSRYRVQLKRRAPYHGNVGSAASGNDSEERPPRTLLCPGRTPVPLVTASPTTSRGLSVPVCGRTQECSICVSPCAVPAQGHAGCGDGRPAPPSVGHHLQQLPAAPHCAAPKHGA